MSGDGVDRPGGYVPGIGWVALFTEMPEGTCYVNRLGGPEGVEDKRSIRGADQRFPAIITRWPDGSTPAPPAPPEADSAAEDRIGPVGAWRYEVSAETVTECGETVRYWVWSIFTGPTDPDDLLLSGCVEWGDPSDVLAAICAYRAAPTSAPPEADSGAEIYRVRQPEGYAVRPVGNHRITEPYFDREGRAIELVCMGDGSVRWELVGRDGEVLEPAPAGEGEAP